MTTSRLEAFSDGVLAIIITIMVLELKVPEEGTFEALKPLIPKMISYIISFIYVGIYWNNHHHLFQIIEKVNGRILWANLILLFCLSLIPFSSAWMGENHFEQNTVIMYATLASLNGVAYYILLAVIKKYNPGNEALHKVLQKQTKKGIISNVFNILAIPAALIHPAISGLFLLFIFFLWLVPDRNIEKIVHKD